MAQPIWDHWKIAYSDERGDIWIPYRRTPGPEPDRDHRVFGPGGPEIWQLDDGRWQWRLGAKGRAKGGGIVATQKAATDACASMIEALRA